MKRLRYQNECLDAYALRKELESNARYGPNAPAATYIYFEGQQVTSFGLEEETLSDGSIVYNIILGGGQV